MAQEQTNSPAERVCPVAPTWPRDVYGNNSTLRRELVRAIGRIQGNEEKYGTFIAHLKEAAQFAQQRLTLQTQLKERAFEEAQVRREKAAEAGRIADAKSNRKSETQEEVRDRQDNAGVGAPVAAKA